MLTTPCFTNEASSLFQSSASLMPSAMHLTLANTDHDERAVLERFVQDEFFLQYRAKVSNFMPWLLGLSCQGQLEGVAGLRPAANTELFVEQYLDTPLETQLTEATGVTVDRSTVIEIGNLAGHHAGVTRVLFPLLTELTCQHGYQWVVCNATRTVQNALRRLGIPLLKLCDADPARLGTARLAWGSYYATASAVIAISPTAARAALLDRHPELLSSCQALLTACLNVAL